MLQLQQWNSASSHCVDLLKKFHKLGPNKQNRFTHNNCIRQQLQLKVTADIRSHSLAIGCDFGSYKPTASYTTCALNGHSDEQGCSNLPQLMSIENLIHERN